MLQNILFVKDGISEKSPDSFNDKFHTSKLPQNHTTRLSSTYQLKVNNLKIERYGRKSVVNKCTLDWNKHQIVTNITLQQTQKKSKTELPNDKRSELKTNIKDQFLKQYNDNKD